MSTPRALRIATYALVYDGLLALYCAQLVGPMMASLLAAAVAVSWWQEPLRERIGGPTAHRAVVGLGAAGFALDLVYLADSVVDALLRLLLFVLLYRLYTYRTRRDARDAAFLSFFTLVLASTTGPGAVYLLVFLAFLAVATWMLILQHVSAEAEDVPTSGTLVGVQLGSRLLGLSVSASVAVLVLTAALFFIIPRIGQAALYRPAVGRMLTGFTERVELGTIGRLETDTTVVMRVRVVDPLGTESWPSLRWRGVVLDHFDGWQWTAARRRHAVLQGTAEEGYQVGSFRGVGPIVRQEIALEPLDNPVIFTAPRPLYVMIRSESLTLDDSGVISVPAAPARLRYAVESELERAPRPGAPSRRRERLAADVRERSLQLPPIAERIRHLARAVTAGSADEADAARRLSAYLAGGEFRYTLVLDRQTELPPIEEFLFVRRSGNCEYFAAALAVMLRSLGIPARVVNGFQRGEWNPYGGYFMVRLLDAHAWVEAYVDGAWSTFDPSPRAFAESAGSVASIGMYLDALRHRWFRYVINWSLYDQVRFAAHLRGIASTERWTAVMSARAPRGWLPVAGGLAIVAAAAFAARRWWRRTDVARTDRRMPRFYRRALRILARGGLSPAAGETAREFSARVCVASPAVGAHLARLTAEYEHVRFGGAALTAETCTALDACLAELAGGLSDRP